MTPEPADLSVLTSTWPGSSVLAIADETSAIGSTGDLDWVTRIASISKLFTSYACLVALEEGTISLDDPAGPARFHGPPSDGACLGVGFRD